MRNINKGNLLEHLDILEESVKGLDEEAVDIIIAIKKYLLVEIFSDSPVTTVTHSFGDLKNRSPKGLYFIKERNGFNNFARLVVIQNGAGEREVCYLSKFSKFGGLEIAITDLWKTNTFVMDKTSKLKFSFESFEPNQHNQVREYPKVYTFQDLFNTTPGLFYEDTFPLKPHIKFLVINNNNVVGGVSNVVLFANHRFGVIEPATRITWKDRKFRRDTEHTFSCSPDYKGKEWLLK